MSDIKKTIPDYPGNSIKEKKVESVVKTPVKRKKQSFGRKLTENFVEEDKATVKDHLLYDVLIPAAKNTLSDMIKGGIDMILFGETSRNTSNTVRNKNRSYVSYGAYYDDPRGRQRNQISPRSRATHSFDDIVLGTRSEAEEVLSHMVDFIIDYGQVTVADMYDLVGVTSDYTDNKWGWVDLSRAVVSPVRGGFIIQLPRTQQL